MSRRSAGLGSRGFQPVGSARQPKRTLPLLQQSIGILYATIFPHIVDLGLCDHNSRLRLSEGVRNEICAMIPSAKEVEHARELLSRYFRPPRFASAESLAQRSGAHVYLKIESDLPTCSFKPRGELNALLQLLRSARCQELLPRAPATMRPVAYAARIAKVGATILIRNANPVKRARIVALGAKVIERGTMG